MLKPVQLVEPQADRKYWQREEIAEVFALPVNDLIFKAASIHRQHFDPNQMQVSTLLSIKTGACPEDCKYCSQSVHNDTNLEREKLLAVEKVLGAAKQAKVDGATRFCMGAGWRSPHRKDMHYVLDMVQQANSLGLEPCMTLRSSDQQKAQRLASDGLDYYNHNLDTSPEYYDQIMTTRSYSECIDTLSEVRNGGIKVCAGGIVGMGEDRKDRVGLLQQLANLPVPPESVPINNLVKVKGTPLAEVEDLDSFEFVRTIAVARILMPTSYVRLSAGRQQMNDEMQALCFMAGANSMFYGERLLTTENPQTLQDQKLLQRLGMAGLA